MDDVSYVMQYTSQYDNDFRVVILQCVVLDYARHDVALDEQTEEFQADIGHDLDMNWAMVIDPHPIDGGDIGSAPQSIQFF